MWYNSVDDNRRVARRVGSDGVNWALAGIQQIHVQLETKMF